MRKRGSGKGGMRRELGEGRTAAEAGLGLCLTAKRSEQRLASGAWEDRAWGMKRGHLRG